MACQTIGQCDIIMARYTPKLMFDARTLLNDRTQPLNVRADAARKLSLELEHWELGKAFYPIYDSEEEDTNLRLIVLAILAFENPAGTIQTLVRPFENPKVRRGALDILDKLPPVTGEQETLLIAELASLRGTLTQQEIESLPLDSGWKQILSAKMSARDPEIGRSCDAVNLPRRWGRDPRVLAFLREELRLPEEDRRRDAVSGLCTLGEIDSALVAADDACSLVRSMLAKMLGYYREESGIEVLKRLLVDNDPDVSKEAKTALRLMNQLEIPRAIEQPVRSSTLGQFLAEISLIQLMDPRIAAEKPDHKIEEGWLGEPGATEEEIASAEQRIGMRLPPSYRAFLAETNGFDDIGPFIYRLCGAADIQWFRIREPEWVSIYQSEPEEEDVSREEHLANPDDCVRFRRAYLSSCLQISDVGDSAVVLLNPEVVNEEGEWETWFFANWNPGATRYSTFQAYVESELKSIKQLRSARGAES